MSAHIAADGALSGYASAAASLAAASRGRYGGPAHSAASLGTAMAGADGLDPEQLVEHARHAAGLLGVETRARSWLSLIISILKGIASGILAAGLSRWVENLLSGEEDEQKAVEGAEECAAVLDGVCDGCTEGVTHIAGSVSAVVEEICRYLRELDPVDNQAEFQAMVDTAARFIDQAGGHIEELCQGRDDSIGECLAQCTQLFDDACADGDASTVPQSETDGGALGSSASAVCSAAGQAEPNQVPDPYTSESGNATSIQENLSQSSVTPSAVQEQRISSSDAIHGQIQASGSAEAQHEARGEMGIPARAHCTADAQCGADVQAASNLDVTGLAQTVVSTAETVETAVHAGVEAGGRLVGGLVAAGAGILDASAQAAAHLDLSASAALNVNWEASRCTLGADNPCQQDTTVTTESPASVCPSVPDTPAEPEEPEGAASPPCEPEPEPQKNVSIPSEEELAAVPEPDPPPKKVPHVLSTPDSASLPQSGGQSQAPGGNSAAPVESQPTAAPGWAPQSAPEPAGEAEPQQGSETDSVAPAEEQTSRSRKAGAW